MAFGVTRVELEKWKQSAASGNIAFLTHYWLDERFPNCNTVTKVGCCHIDRLIEWGAKYGLKREWIDNRGDYPHFDLFSERQYQILRAEGQFEQIERFKLGEQHEN